MAWRSLFNTVKGYYPPGLRRTLLIIIGITTICGCSSYDEDMVWEDAYNSFNRSCQYNPRFIFDNAGKNDRVCQISSEQFGRLP